MSWKSAQCTVSKAQKDVKARKRRWWTKILSQRQCFQLFCKGKGSFQRKIYFKVYWSDLLSVKFKRNQSGFFFCCQLHSVDCVAVHSSAHRCLNSINQSRREKSLQCPLLCTPFDEQITSDQSQRNALKKIWAVNNLQKKASNILETTWQQIL